MTLEGRIVAERSFERIRNDDPVPEPRPEGRSLSSLAPGADGCWYIACRPWSGETAMIARSGVIHTDPNILSGTPVFVGTRVPAQSLFDYLEGGETLDDFLRQFPSVTREQAIAALDLARDSVIAGARPS